MSAIHVAFPAKKQLSETNHGIGLRFTPKHYRSWHAVFVNACGKKYNAKNTSTETAFMRNLTFITVFGLFLLLQLANYYYRACSNIATVIANFAAVLAKTIISYSSAPFDC